MSVIVLFIVLFAFIFLGVPVGFAIGGATMISMLTTSNLNMVVNAQYCYSGIFSFTVMAIPFFMLAGIVMSTGGIAKKIVRFCEALIGSVVGGLGCVAMLACMFFGAISGSGMATTSAIGSMLIPEMKEKGYPGEYAVTLVCFGGIVGPIIPPSLSFVLYGSSTGVSIADLFLAGILPGIMIGLGFMMINYYFCRKYKMGVIPAKAVDKLEAKAIMRQKVKELWLAFREGFWALLSPVIILGGIYSGIFTPTEAACVSVVYSILVSVFIYRDMNWKGIYKTFVEAAVLNGITSFLLGYSTVFSTFMTFERVPDLIYNFLLGISDSKIVMLLIINLVLLLIGCFLDTVPAIIVMAPLLLPAVKQFGVDPIHFGVIMAVNLALGLCSPPYGCNLFVGCAVGKVKMQQLFKWLIPFFAMGVIMVMIVTFVPKISLMFF
ncbi:MAG: TRAP transporter large permease [Firmicutes bacterium]|nr:TRAP transporter large permease [Bacillota bacterium]